MGDRGQIFQAVPPNLIQISEADKYHDCFETFIESPRNLLTRAQCYSQYKKHTTIKIFRSCTPLDAVNFLSKCWGGRASDIQIALQPPLSHVW